MTRRTWKWHSREPEPKDNIPPELAKYIRFESDAWGKLSHCEWEGEALMTARGDKLEEVRGQLREKYNINPLFDADAIYRILDRIYHLEKRVKQLETKR